MAAIVTALVAAWKTLAGPELPPRPCYFPTADEYEERLAAHGLATESIELIPRPTPLKAGMESWLGTFAGPYVNALPPEVRTSYVDRTLELLAHSLRGVDGNWTADYVRLRFRASKEA